MTKQSTNLIILLHIFKDSLEANLTNLGMNWRSWEDIVTDQSLIMCGTDTLLKNTLRDLTDAAVDTVCNLCDHSKHSTEYI